MYISKPLKWQSYYTHHERRAEYEVI